MRHGCDWTRGVVRKLFSPTLMGMASRCYPFVMKEVIIKKKTVPQLQTEPGAANTPKNKKLKITCMS